MSPTSLQTERLILANPMDARLPRSVSNADWLVAALTSPELIALVIFCGIGLLLTVAINIAVPNYGDVVVSLQPFL